MRYAHTNIVAADWRRLVTFYEEVFGCKFLPPERDQAGDWLSVATGVPDAKLTGKHLLLPGHGETGPTLEIFSYDEMLEKHPPAANRKGLGHLAFEVDDVRATLTRLLRAGGGKQGEVVEQDIGGVGRITLVYAADPEGNIIELQSWERGED